MMSTIFQEFVQSFGCGQVVGEAYAVIDGEPKRGRITVNNGHGNRHTGTLSYVLPGLYEDRFRFQFGDACLTCRREFRNLSPEPMKLTELGFELRGLTFGGARRDDFFYHNENPRIYEVMAFPIDYDRTSLAKGNEEFEVQVSDRWTNDPGVVCERIGHSPYQPFPAILLGNVASDHGLVHGTLSQRVFYHNYLVSHDDDEQIRLEILSSFKATAYRLVKPQEILVDEWYLGTTEQAGDIEHIFDGYTAALRKVLPPLYGATDINRTSMVWGSWNDGIGRKISEELILTEAEYLKRNFPTVRWIQVDDGYAVNVPPAHGLGMVYEGEQGVDQTKFPHGLRAFTDKVRDIGLRPALWIGGMCPNHTPIAQEHPEWFLPYSYRDAHSCPLDVSVPEARAYMEHALDVLCTEYGFEGVKHDFWSYAFEDSYDLYRNHDGSGYEYRDWWLKELRKRLARDGYLQTGCDIVMGNPFLGEFFTNYRYGIDIGSGNWDYVKTNYLWGMACFATHTSDLFVPNSDSVGLFPGLNDTEAVFCINYCLVTHTMVEIAGRLSQHPDSPRLAMLKKAVCNPQNGQEIFFGKWNYLDPRDRYPAVIYFKTAHFCPKENQPGLPVRTVGLFNLEDGSKQVSFSVAELGLEEGRTYGVTDVWSGERLALDGILTCELPPHGSRLLAIHEPEGLQLLDANVRILTSAGDEHSLTLTFDYAYVATLTFNQTLRRARLNGEPLELDGTSPSLRLNVPAGATLTVER